MAILTQEYNFGWYGECDDLPCTEFPLSVDDVISKIETVYEINTTGTSYASWESQAVIPGVGDFNEQFRSLGCGKTYLIRLKPGSSITIT